MKRCLKVIVMTLIITCTTTLTAFADEKFSNLKDVENDIYTHFQNRDMTFSFLYKGPKNEFESRINQVITDAYSKDDYLERSWVEIKPKAYVTSNGIETTINVQYQTTKEQEAYVDKEVKRIVDSIIVPGMSEFEKVKAINDYIIDRYNYDYTLKSVNAYSALTTSVAVCQGYAMTAYKMLNYAGIKNRIVVGTDKNISHAWNLVNLYGKWYHLDITNNDSILFRNKYFLVDDKFLEENKYVWNKTNYPAAIRGYYN